MKTIIRTLSIVGLLALGTRVSAAAIEAPLVHQQSVSTTYQDGYNQGFRETLENKCIDGNNFQANYVRYEQRAQSNYDNSIGTSDEDYYRGYLDGLHDGYNQPVSCGGPTGGGPGGGNPPCSTCGPGPYPVGE